MGDAMAGDWAGFSEQELRRLQGKRPELSEAPPEQQHRPSSINKSRQQLQRKKPVQQLCGKPETQDGAVLAPPEQRLSAPKPSLSSPQTSVPPAQSPSFREQRGAINQRVQPGLEQSSNGDERTQNHSTEPSCNPERKKMELQEKPHWEVLQQEQKLMEEKNKRKKALLAKAIAERSKRTQAETVKLKRIQKELQALDDLVSADVGILRNRIDQACLDYSSARKRFDKAEAEYVVAKLDLQKKSEIKEQLTEHLCTIIQQNEQRKARKLEELMQQLEVVVDEESLELEIEVEQMLLQQEGGALGQGVQLRKPVPPAAEVTTPQGNSQEDKIESLQAGGSEQLVEKTADSYSGDQGHSMR
ncbi:RAB6-interacting golgin [Sphaerodactylus townsendi]|uniref:RAB6-interacting golgin n=1 Tax=Sphaerodactylus townsendi TaxID=933632 RepID=UPI00202617E7|nr:RAB6-interacting golgin [Sphaerodactylus townsendi]